MTKIFLLRKWPASPRSGVTRVCAWSRSDCLRISGKVDGGLQRARRSIVNPLADEGIAPLDAWYILEFKRPGIQNGVYRKLRLGHYQLDARLDLHRFAIKQAREEVFSFIGEASHLGLRTLLIVHGKGHSKANGDKTAVLKGYVNQWLRELEAVQAFHSAQPQHGGTGAVYVLLRKSAEQKRENRLKYLKGRVQD